MVQTIRLGGGVCHSAVLEVRCGGPVEMVVVLPTTSVPPMIGSGLRVLVGNCR
jgi:hypothetical protein